MSRLTPDEIGDLRSRLSQWQSPREMARLVGHAMDRLGSPDLFNRSGLAFIRDAWISAAFGQARQANYVRLVADDWPDFEMEIGAVVECFEAVEADDPSRRRGVEYRGGVEEVEDDPVEDWIARAEEAPVWLQTACRKKAAKRYAGRAGLVIYLNLSEYGIRQEEVEACFMSATAAVKDRFDSVWVLWQERVYRVWPQTG